MHGTAEGFWPIFFISAAFEVDYLYPTYMPINICSCTSTYNRYCDTAIRNETRSLAFNP
ncbi:hypothetical protein BGX38DRAFT_1217190 [Terfezia claveryi]|nr:hypothetical protein BGX38DRAFT_1217190 [Terfezia claveryi]